jgi:hypothetical protein
MTDLYITLARVFGGFVTRKGLCTCSRSHDGPFVCLRNYVGDEYFLCMNCFNDLADDFQDEEEDEDETPCKES